MIRFNKKSFMQAYLRLMRHSGTPESVGRGVAIGLFVAFIIPFSLQMLIAFPLALLFRAARFPALLFCWVSNPLTIPFLYPLQCYVGSFLLGNALSYSYTKNLLSGFIQEPSIKGLLRLGIELAFAFLVGGLLFGAIAAVIGYFTSIKLINNYRHARHTKLKNRQIHLRLRHQRERSKHDKTC
jgi:uncharacterized protein